MKIRIIPEDKKLLKSSKVRKLLRHAEELISEQLLKQNADEKIIEAIAHGVPLVFLPDGSIRVVKDNHLTFCHNRGRKKL